MNWRVGGLTAGSTYLTDCLTGLALSDFELRRFSVENCVLFLGLAGDGTVSPVLQHDFFMSF